METQSLKELLYLLCGLLIFINLIFIVRGVIQFITAWQRRKDIRRFNHRFRFPPLRIPPPPLDINFADIDEYNHGDTVTVKLNGIAFKGLVGTSGIPKGYPSYDIMIPGEKEVIRVPGKYISSCRLLLIEKK